MAVVIENQPSFHTESIGHDIRSTQFCRGGCVDTLMANEFKEPGIVCYAIENHPADSRIKVDRTGTFQSLTARCGTGGQHADDIGCFQNTGIGWWNEGEIAECLRTPSGSDAVNANLIAVKIRN